MIEAIATVVAIKSGIARVQYSRATACGHCQHQSSCGISSDTDDKNQQDHTIDIECPFSVEVGQQVRIGIPERGLLKTAMLAYLLPLFSLIAGAAIGQLLSESNSELLVIAGAFLGCLAGFILMRLRSTRLTHTDYKPVILGVNIPVCHIET